MSTLCMRINGPFLTWLTGAIAQSIIRPLIENTREASAAVRATTNV
jgi:hypothetical protein